MTIPKCAAGQIPVVRMAFAKQACVRMSTPADTPEKITEHVREKYGCQPQEYFVAVALDVRMAPLAIIEVAVGGFTSAPMDPKVLFSGLLLAGATAFVMFHNHPSGDPEPSEQDVALTRQCKEGARILGIQLVDHIVIGQDKRIVSFASRGLLPR